MPKDAFVSNPTWICVTECYGVENQVQSILTAGFAHLMVNYFFFSVIYVIDKESPRIHSTSKVNC